MRNVLTGILVLVGFQLFLVLRQIKMPKHQDNCRLFPAKHCFTWLSRFVGGNNDIVAFNHNG